MEISREIKKFSIDLYCDHCRTVKMNKLPELGADEGAPWKYVCPVCGYVITSDKSYPFIKEIMVILT